MNANDYQQLAARTAPLAWGEANMLLNAALGLADESGEVAKIVLSMLEDCDETLARALVVIITASDLMGAVKKTAYHKHAPPTPGQILRLINEVKQALSHLEQHWITVDRISIDETRIAASQRDRDDLADELGDVQWYAAEAATAAGLTMGDVMHGNISKLAARYPDGFDPERSRNRVDS